MPLKVVADDDPMARVRIDRTLQTLATLDLNAMMAVEYLHRPDLMVRVDVPQKRIVLMRRCDPVVLGGVIEGVPYVLPQFRGLGFGAELVCFSDLHRGFGLKPGLYSVSGLRGRVGAHRRHVERMLGTDPGAVPARVRAEYVTDDTGHLRRIDRWDVEEQIFWWTSCGRVRPEREPFRAANR